jgi:hypothetical protein
MYKSYRRVFSLILIAMLSVFIAGCSGGPKLNEVTGKVTLDGVPKGGIGIRFDPLASGVAPGAATTKDDGSYVLYYPAGKVGIPAGEYKVVFFIQETEDGPPNWTIPAKYGEKSEISATVNVGKNELNFDLTTK